MVKRPPEEAPSRLAKQQRVFKRAIVLLGRRVRELRHQRGWSYADLSEMSGITVRQLVRLENQPETQNPTFATLTSVAEALGVDPHELLVPARSGVQPKRTTDEAPTAPAPVLPIALPRSGRKKKKASSR